jgi:Spy/CpxP family protein refolding chaperone
MKTKRLIVAAVCLIAAGALAQTTAPAVQLPDEGTYRTMGPHPMMGEHRMIIRHEMGKWWKNSDIAQKLQLNSGQVSQLDEIYYQHRLKLIDYGADMEKQDMKLQSLLDADVPNEGQINTQVDQVLSARGKLEREFTMMNLDLRKVLSLDQWKQLKTMHAEHGHGDMMYFHKKVIPGPPGMPPGQETMPPMPPPSPGPGESD